MVFEIYPEVSALGGRSFRRALAHADTFRRAGGCGGQGVSRQTFIWPQAKSLILRTRRYVTHHCKGWREPISIRAIATHGTLRRGRSFYLRFLKPKRRGWKVYDHSSTPRAASHPILVGIMTRTHPVPRDNHPALDPATLPTCTPGVSISPTHPYPNLRSPERKRILN